MITNIRLIITKSGYNLYIDVIFHLTVSFFIKKGYNNRVRRYGSENERAIVPALYWVI